MSNQRWSEHVGGWKVLRVFGIGALVAGAATVALWLLVAAVLIAPLVFWLAWNVLDFGPAIGLPELGFAAIVMATLFLVVGWFAKVVLTGIVFLVDPSWFTGQAAVSWPEPTIRNFVAIGLLALLAASPHAREQRADDRHRSNRRNRRRRRSRLETGR